MNNRKLLSSLFAGLLLFSACETDRESNPTLTVPESFVLNTPAMASGTYDLDNSSSVELTCTQPEYGYTAPVIYTVEASLDSSFSTVETLTTTYTSAQMEVSASELAVAVTNLKIAVEELSDADFPLTTAVQVRLKADLSNIEATVYSNSIELNVFLSYSLPPVTYPENMYLVGAHCDWSWDTATIMTSVYGSSDYEYNGQFWAMVYFPASAGLKINTATSWNGGELGYEGVTLVDNAGAELYDDGGNIGITNEGWYIVRVTTVIDGVNLLYTVEFNSPNVYLYGDTNGGDWEALEANLFTVPADGTGEFVSPAFVGAGEIRATVVLPDTDWWKSEFIVIGGELQYRANGPDQDRVSGTAGQKLYINFADGTGKVE